MIDSSLGLWRLILDLDLTEAASLVLGVDPASSAKTELEKTRIRVFERAIAEAVQRASHYAWINANQLDQLLLFSEENKDLIEAHKSITDIWERSPTPKYFLPSLEIRRSICEVFSDPENVPILLPIDPWYTATICAQELNRWLRANSIKSHFDFVDGQKVMVTTRFNNWDSQQSKGKSSEQDPPSVEGVRKFAEEVESSEKPMGTKERNVLLTILGVVCTEAKLDYKRHAKTAGLICGAAATLGVSIGETTIENHLKKIPDALASRLK